MPADLDRRSDGTGAMFSVRQTPWHREGQILDQAPQSIERALELAGLDFDVGFRSVFAGAPGQPLVELADYRATCRMDRDEVLGVVGKRYVPFQNRDAFAVLEPLLDSGRASLETAGCLEGGKNVWVLVRFDMDDPLVQETFAEEIVPYGLISNNHAGERGVVLQETPIRVVCSNTLGAAHSTARRDRRFRIRHTINVEARTVEAAQTLWRTLIERMRSIAEQYQLLKACYLDEAMFRQLVLDRAAPIKEEWRRSPAARQQQRALERAAARRAVLNQLWHSGRGHKAEGSAWEAYNGAVEAIDHETSLWPTRGSRVQSMIDGSLARAKQDVLDGLSAYAATQRG